LEPQTIRRKEAMLYAFDRNSPPKIIVEPRERFIIETEDALSGRIKSDLDLPVDSLIGDLSEKTPALSNPIGGPVSVRGAERGDVLVVHIDDIIVDGLGWTAILPGKGPFRDSARWPLCRGPYVRIIRHMPGLSGTTSDGKAMFDPHTTWNLEPFIGTIGVAPEREIESSAVGQGPWGGNLDCRDICKNSKIFLPVYNTGGLLFIGDVHGSQADSELSGVADETKASVTLSCEVLKNKKIPYVRIEKSDSIIQLNNDKPLEDALMQAFIWMMEWLTREYDFDEREAYMHMSANPDVRINVYQMVSSGKLRYTVGVQFPKAHL
jgi:amidase